MNGTASKIYPESRVEHPNPADARNLAVALLMALSCIGGALAVERDIPTYEKTQTFRGQAFFANENTLGYSAAFAVRFRMSKSLNSSFTNKSVTEAQNDQHLQVGNLAITDGTTLQVDDVWFKIDTAHTEEQALVILSADIALLSDLAHFDNVHSLHQVMARDISGHLKGFVQQYADPTARKAVLSALIYAWAGVENVDPLSRAATQIYGNVIGDARKLATLEAFLGEGYLGTWCWGERDANPHSKAAPILLDAFDQLAAFMDGQLMAQTQYKGLYDAIGLAWNATTGSLELDVSGLVASLKAGYAANSSAGPAEAGNDGFWRLAA